MRCIMKDTEIQVTGENPKIEKVVFIAKTKTLQLYAKNELNSPHSDPKRLMDSLLLQRRIYDSSECFSEDSFDVELTPPNVIVITGEVENAIRILEERNFLNEETIKNLKVSAELGERVTPLTDFFSEKSSFQSTQGGSSEAELSSILSSRSKEEVDDKKVESEITELFQLFPPEYREKVLRFSDLLERLGSKKDSVLQKLSSGRNTPGMNKD